MEPAKLSDWDCCTYERYSWPITTTDEFEGREWIHPNPPRYYLHQRPEDGFWCIIDRTLDLSVSRPVKTKNRAIRLFLKQFERVGEPLGFTNLKRGSRCEPA